MKNEYLAELHLNMKDMTKITGQVVQLDICMNIYVHIYTKFLCTLELKQWQVQFGTQILTRDLLLPCCCCLLPAVLYSFFRTLGLGPDLSHRYCPNADHMSHDFPAAATAAAVRSQLYLHRYVSEVRCV